MPKYVHAHDLGIIVCGWAPDWPDGYGQFYYIVDGAAISPAGNTNLSELNDPVVNNLLTKFGSTTDDAARNALTGQIDMQVMKDAAILPGRVRQVAALPAPEPDQRVRPAVRTACTTTPRWGLRARQHRRGSKHDRKMAVSTREQVMAPVPGYPAGHRRRAQ